MQWGDLYLSHLSAANPAPHPTSPLRASLGRAASSSSCHGWVRVGGVTEFWKTDYPVHLVQVLRGQFLQIFDLIL